MEKIKLSLYYELRRTKSINYPQKNYYSTQKTNPQP